MLLIILPLFIATIATLKKKKKKASGLGGGYNLIKECKVSLSIFNLHQFCENVKIKFKIDRQNLYDSGCSFSSMAGHLIHELLVIMQVHFL